MKKIIISLILILVLLFLYGRYIEINNFKINEYVINTKEIPNSFKDLKIIHFSDILYEPNYNTKLLDNLVKNINDNEPDILIFTGDLLKKGNKYQQDDYDLLIKYLSQMEASLYKYAVIGDNDLEYLEEYKDILNESKFKLLNNENMLFFYKDETPINIIGISNINEINMEELLKSDIEFHYNLVITHKPDDFIQLSNYDVDTVLSGHSLGGIINIPYYGGIIKKDGAKTYINNKYTINNKELFISNGLGYEKYNFRFLNTPSINIYHFSK